MFTKKLIKYGNSATYTNRVCRNTQVGRQPVFYHILAGSKSEMEQAKRLVVFFAKNLLPKTAQQPSGKQALSQAA
jgi:hypothetical protein